MSVQKRQQGQCRSIRNLTNARAGNGCVYTSCLRPTCRCRHYRLPSCMHQLDCISGRLLAGAAGYRSLCTAILPLPLPSHHLAACCAPCCPPALPSWCPLPPAHTFSLPLRHPACRRSSKQGFPALLSLLLTAAAIFPAVQVEYAEIAERCRPVFLPLAKLLESPYRPTR